MSNWKNFWGHLGTVNKHRKLVRKHCFDMGLYYQGLTHDLTKYSPTEFKVGIKYYTGVKSPNAVEKRTIGYSSAWLHHKGRNKHHLEYWIDYDLSKGSGMCGIKMPLKYVAEMMADRMAACQTYHGAAFTYADPYEYYMQNKREQSMIHPETEKLLISWLTMLKDEGEEKTMAYIRRFLKENKTY